MKLSKGQVSHIAKLARIGISDEEGEVYSEQLSVILDYIDQLNEVDTNGVAVTRQITGLTDVWRADAPAESHVHEELLDAAPLSDGKTIGVKEIL